VVAGGPASKVNESPKVSAIMPTRGRTRWAWDALQCFLQQPYPNKELVILDDTEQPSFGQAPNMDGVIYSRVPGRMNIPDKRNRCCELASGVYVIHWDDDDWSSTDRMWDQVARLQVTGLAVTGYRSLLFFDVATGNASRYIGPKNYALGSSLAYRRTWWEQHQFKRVIHSPNDPNIHGIGEDNQFGGEATNARQLITVDGGGLMVARIHSGNTSRKDATGYTRVPADEVPAAFLKVQ
jgi:O-antigen biosynthesis protein